MKKALGIILALLMTLSMFVIGVSAALSEDAIAALARVEEETKAEYAVLDAAALEAAYPGLFTAEQLAALADLVDPWDFLMDLYADWIDTNTAGLDEEAAYDLLKGLAGYNLLGEDGGYDKAGDYEAAVADITTDIDPALLEAAAYSLEALAYLEALDATDWDEDNAEALADALVIANLLNEALKAAIAAGGATLEDFPFASYLGEFEAVIDAIEAIADEEELAALVKEAEALLEEYAEDEDEDLQEMLEGLAEYLEGTTVDKEALQEMVDTINQYLEERAEAKEVNDMIKALAALDAVIDLLKKVDDANFDEDDAAALADAIAALEAIQALFAEPEEAEEGEEPTEPAEPAEPVVLPTSEEIFAAIAENGDAAAAAIASAAAKLAAALAEAEEKIEELEGKIEDLEDDINNPETGYLKQIDDLKKERDALDKLINDPVTGYKKVISDLNKALDAANATIKAFNDANWLNNIPSWLGFLKIDTWGKFFQGIVYYLLFGWTWGWGF